MPKPFQRTALCDLHGNPPGKKGPEETIQRAQVQGPDQDDRATEVGVSPDFQVLYSAVVLSSTDGSGGQESACNAGDPGSIPGLGRSPGEANGNPLQFLPGESHGQRSLVSFIGCLLSSLP